VNFAAGWLTLGTLENTLLLASSESAVDVASIGRIGGGRQCVVGLDVLLDGLATVEELAGGPQSSRKSKADISGQRHDQNKN
jgi:hypothetical protein